MRELARACGDRVVGSGSDLREGLEAAGALIADAAIVECGSAGECLTAASEFERVSQGMITLLLPPDDQEPAVAAALQGRTSTLVVPRRAEAIERAFRRIRDL